MTHWAYIEWTPAGEGSHDVVVTADHKHKACAAKSEPTEVSFDCEALDLLPDLLRHVVSAGSKDGALSAARCWALNFTPYGADYRIVYIGAIEGS